MRGAIIARNYAEALFQLARREDRLEEYGAALDLVAGVLEDSPRFRLFLETPRIATDRKKEVLREGFGEHVPPFVLNFLFLTLDRRRQRLLPQMARAFGDLLDELMGRTHVEVQVARPMDDDELEAVRRRLSEVLGKKAIAHLKVRPELLGGIAFRSGDTIFDGSVRRRLQGMRRRLLAADISTP